MARDGLLHVFRKILVAGRSVSFSGALHGVLCVAMAEGGTVAARQRDPNPRHTSRPSALSALGLFSRPVDRPLMGRFSVGWALPGSRARFACATLV